MKTALITGASGGIGYELARLFARDGYDLILVARSREKMEEIAAGFEREHPIKVDILVRDLSAAGAGSELYQAVSELGKEVDCLVNNAGFGHYGKFQEGDLQKYQKMIALNATALTELTYLVVREMLARGSGRILNIASTAGFQPDPFLAVYGATKAYVLHFSEALASELKGTGVTVSVLCPGPTATGFQAVASMERARVFQGGVMHAETVARAGYQGMMNGQMTILPGLRNKALALASSIALSRRLRVAVTRWFMKEARHET